MIRTGGAVAAAAALAMVVTAGGAMAARTQRVEEASYVGGTPPGVNLNATLIEKGVGGVIIPGGGEKTVTIDVTDDSGLPASFALTQDTSGDGVPELRHDACGATTKPVKIEPNTDIIVYLFQEPCDGGGVATSGTVTATFSKGRVR